MFYGLYHGKSQSNIIKAPFGRICSYMFYIFVLSILFYANLSNLFQTIRWCCLDKAASDFLSHIQGGRECY